MPLAAADFFGAGANDEPQVVVSPEATPEAVLEPEAASAAPEPEEAPAPASSDLPETDFASEPMPGVNELAKSIVEAAAEAARARSRRHTVVYSARPLDDSEMEAVAAYVQEKLDGPATDDWLDASSATDVRIVVDGQVVEGTLDINDEPDLENVVDESLIMGIRIVRGDTVIDGSLRHRLDELKHTMHS